MASRIQMKITGVRVRPTIADRSIGRVAAGVTLVFVLAVSTVTGATLTVTTTSDVVNGDVSSPAALIAQPGPDGVSLREAIEASNRAIGPHEIRFGEAIRGATIALRDSLPQILQSGITINGLAGQDGRPAVTLDASGLTAPSSHVVLSLAVSETTFRRMRVRLVPQILQGAIGIDVLPATRGRVVHSVVIEGSEFDNSGYVPGPGFGPHGLKLTTGGPGGPTPGGFLRDITIRRNVFKGFGGDSDAILGGPSGEGSRMENLRIEGNTFLDSTFCVELGGHTGPNVVMRGITIRGNHFENFAGGALVGIGTGGNRFENVRIEGNTFVGGNAGIMAGTFEGPESTGSNVVVAGNAFRGVNLAVVVHAEGLRNRVSDIIVRDNTASGPGGGLNVITRGEQNVVERILVSGNVFSAVSSIGPEGRGGVIRNVVIERNRNNNLDFFLSLSGGVNGQNCTLQNVVVANNVARGGVDMRGGFLSGTTGCAIERIRIVNNTFVTEDVSFPGARAFANAEGASGNEIRGLEIVNCIIDTPGADFAGEIEPRHVRSCLVEDSAFRDRNGNVSGTPLFVDRAAGDYHLQPASPAIDRGSAEDAPPADFDCRARVGLPEIGAFEFGAAAVELLELEVIQGAGTLETTPAGLECGMSRGFPPGTPVILSATPHPGWRFGGWSGDADCADGAVTVDRRLRCLAAFAPAHRRAVGK
ncbi:MAG TPA: right-handed parallel beta-helix repeat-containing protein [Thermoanaerobaculia bacterium]|nr:right-handed parallel beta-helix repeat-containing protein [Thermoanaerobaculia bacterium]